MSDITKYFKLKKPCTLNAPIDSRRPHGWFADPNTLTPCYTNINERISEKELTSLTGAITRCSSQIDELISVLKKNKDKLWELEFLLETEDPGHYQFDGWTFHYDYDSVWPLTGNFSHRKKAGENFWTMLDRFCKLSQEEQSKHLFCASSKGSIVLTRSSRFEIS